MLTFTNSKENNNSCLTLLGAKSLLSGNSKNESTNLISKNASLLSNDCNCSLLDTCSFYSEPSDDAILSFGESFEYGEVAYNNGGESCGSIAYSGGGESCGSIASSSVSTSSCCSCSYSC